MTATDFTQLVELLSGVGVVVCFGLGYIGGYLQ